MQNPSDLYHLSPYAVEDSRPGVLVVALGAVVDAGAVQQQLAEHLVKTGNPEVVGSFEIDQLYDYRGRRPTMIFDRDRWVSYETPRLVLQRLTDRDGHPYHLLAGTEPDFQWDRVVAAIKELVEALQVMLTVTVYGIPMGVPHTRPVGLTAHATDAGLLREARSPFGRVQVPGSVSSLLELRLGEAGNRAAGYAIHVPHYLAASEFAEGALTGLNAIVDLTGLNLPNDALVAKVAENQRAIAAELADNDEVRAVVAALEQQYDAFMAGQPHPDLWVGGASRIPSADLLGEEFENFLRSVSDDDDTPE